MISGEFKKVKQGKTAEYIFHCNGQKKATAIIPLNAPREDLFYMDIQDGRYGLHFLPTRQMKQITTDFDHGNIAYEIELLEKQVGYICAKKRGGIFSGYMFDAIVIKGIQYHIYFVELGEQGKRILFYKVENGVETQIAEVRKGNTVINRLDEYFYQVTEEEYLLPVGLYLLFFDFRLNLQFWGEIVVDTKETLISTTKNAHLLEKYNPNFWQTQN